MVTWVTTRFVLIFLDHKTGRQAVIRVQWGQQCKNWDELDVVDKLYHFLMMHLNAAVVGVEQLHHSSGLLRGHFGHKFGVHITMHITRVIWVLHREGHWSTVKCSWPQQHRIGTLEMCRTFTHRLALSPCLGIRNWWSYPRKAKRGTLDTSSSGPWVSIQSFFAIIISIWTPNRQKLVGVQRKSVPEFFWWFSGTNSV